MRSLTLRDSRGTDRGIRPMPSACPTCGFPLDPGAACARCASTGTNAGAPANGNDPPRVADPVPTTLPPQPVWAAAATERPEPPPAPSSEDTGSRRARNAAFDIAPSTGKHAAPRSSLDTTPALWLRAAAFFVDLGAVLLLGAIFYVAGAVAYGLSDLRAAGGGSAMSGAATLLASAPTAAIACGLVFFAVTSGYFVWFPGAESRTPGMALFGLRVVRTDGSALGMAGAIQRWGAFLLATAFFGLGVLWTAFSDVQRGLHDHLAGTQVVRA